MTPEELGPEDEERRIAGVLPYREPFAMMYQGWIRRGSELPGRCFLVFTYLVMRSNEEGRAWPTQTRIAEELGISLRSVNRCINDLVKHGWMSKTSSEQRPNLKWCHKIYLITGPPD